MFMAVKFTGHGTRLSGADFPPTTGEPHYSTRSPTGDPTQEAALGTQFRKRQYCSNIPSDMAKHFLVSSTRPLVGNQCPCSLFNFPRQVHSPRSCVETNAE